MTDKHALADLLQLMARLRAPEDGCPWDRRQTPASIVPYTLEEAYEVADAIDRGKPGPICDELGDLLFQVVFQTQLAQEQGQFDFSDVVDGIVRKLLRRHPHVFPEGTLDSRLPPGTRVSEADIRVNWERIKAAERAMAPEAPSSSGTTASASVLDGIARSLPAALRAEKLQQRAAHHSFDWPDAAPVFAKWQEEFAELQEAWDGGQGDPEQIEDEFGDMLFVGINLARFLKVDPEKALRRTNAKFERRFRFMEQALQQQGLTMEGQTLERLDDLWNQAKQQEGSQTKAG